MVTRTPLHTRPEQLDTYQRAAHDLLDSLARDVDALRHSNLAADEAYPDLDVRTAQLAHRFELDSWTDHTLGQLRDLLYLLAVGDCSDEAAATVDGNHNPRRTPDEHLHDRREAVQRLQEQGLIS